MPSLTTRAECMTYLERDVNNSSQPRKIRLREEEGHFSDLLDVALERFSADRPDLGRHSITGDNSTFEWILDDTISDWTRGISTITELRLNSTLSTEREEEVLDQSRDDYEVKEILDSGTVKEQLRLINRTPSTTETLEIWYTRLHTMTSTGFSLLASDRLAFMDLAAAMAYDKMSELAASLEDVETGETTEWGELVDRYARLRDRRLKRYRQHINEGGSTGAAAGFVNIVTEAEMSPGTRFSHNIRSRG